MEKTELFLTIAAFVIVIVALLISFIVMPRIHCRKIYEEIESFGGEIIGIEKCYFSKGPFMTYGKGRTIYRFDYKLGDERKEGWVKFGTWFGPDWRI